MKIKEFKESIYELDEVKDEYVFTPEYRDYIKSEILTQNYTGVLLKKAVIELNDGNRILEHTFSEYNWFDSGESDVKYSISDMKLFKHIDTVGLEIFKTYHFEPMPKTVEEFEKLALNGGSLDHIHYEGLNISDEIIFFRYGN